MPLGTVEIRAAARTAAALLFAASLVLFSGCGDPLKRGGETHFEAGRYQEAVQVFQEAVRKDPEDSEAHLWLARSYSELHRVEDAVREYDRAVALSQSKERQVREHRLHYWRQAEVQGEALLSEAVDMKAGPRKTERLSEAEAALQAARAYSSEKAITDYHLARLHQARGENREAEEALERAFAKAESDREAVSLLVPILRERGEAAIMDNRFREALSIYERAVRLDPNDARTLGDLAAAHLLMAEDSETSKADQTAAWREAARLLEQVRKMTPDDPDALYNLATVRYRLGSPASADSLLRLYMAKKPRDPDGYALFAEVAGRLGREDEASTAGMAASVLDSGKPVEDAADWARGASDKFGRSSAVGQLHGSLGVPDEIRTLKRRNGDLVEVWFYFEKGRVGAFHRGAPAGAVLSFGRR